MISDILAGIISGLLIIIISTAYTAMVFKGPLLTYFAFGISYIAVGACLINLLTSTFSQFKYAIARPEPASGIILAIIFSHIISNTPENAILPTLLIAMAVTSLTVGVVMYYFRHLICRIIIDRHQKNFPPACHTYFCDCLFHIHQFLFMDASY